MSLRFAGMQYGRNEKQKLQHSNMKKNYQQRQTQAQKHTELLDIGLSIMNVFRNNKRSFSHI